MTKLSISFCFLFFRLFNKHKEIESNKYILLSNKLKRALKISSSKFCSLKEFKIISSKSSKSEFDLLIFSFAKRCRQFKIGFLLNE